VGERRGEPGTSGNEYATERATVSIEVRTLCLKFSLSEYANVAPNLAVLPHRQRILQNKWKEVSKRII
jgi:hypothetical protein